MALMNASVQNVIIALTIPEIPRVVRLVRALVLSLRGEQAFVEASRAIGAGIWRVLLRHVTPNTVAPAHRAGHVHLRFGGHLRGVPQLSWRRHAAKHSKLGQHHGGGAGRTCQIAFWIILFPGLLLAFTVLAINLLGDGLRDTLDPKLARRM